MNMHAIVLAGLLIVGAGGVSMGKSVADGTTAVERATGGVDASRIRADVDALASFGTRHTASDTESDVRGIGAARRWLKQRFEDGVAESGRAGELACEVWFDSHRVEADGRRILADVDVVNVMCRIPGADVAARDRLYYVLAHYDSRASDGADGVSDAPGANDDASGVAVLLELARVLSRERLDATVVLMATAGEEQGLYGARLHARALRERGANVAAVLNNDTVGDPSGPDGRMARDVVRVFSEGVPAGLVRDGEMGDVRSMRTVAGELDSPSRQLARYVAEVAAAHSPAVEPMLVFRADRFLRGVDHTAFNEEGWAAVRFVEVYEDYTKQHQDVRVEDGVSYGDLPEFVDAKYIADVTRLNAMTLVHLANAPAEPADVRIIVAELTNDTTLRWERVDGASGYEVVWRETTSPVWTEARDVGDRVEATLPLSKDHWVFGVRSYDADGFLSPVVFPRPSRD